MMPEISHFPNSQFYESELKDGPNVLASDYGMEFANASPYGAYAFIDCGTGAEVAQPKGWSNPQEVAVVTKLVICLGKGTNSVNDLSLVYSLICNDDLKLFHKIQQIMQIIDQLGTCLMCVVNVSSVCREKNQELERWCHFSLRNASGSLEAVAGSTTPKQCFGR